MVHLNELTPKLIKGLKKYKYAFLILILGIVLLLLPGRAKKAETTAPQTAVLDESSYAEALAKRLSEELSNIDGAGQVRVVLTLKTGAQTKYQSDTTLTNDTDESGTRSNEERKTVILSEGSAYDKAAVASVEYPRFQGALILSADCDNAAVKKSLIDAVAALTGLNSAEITVVKLK